MFEICRDVSEPPKQTKPPRLTSGPVLSSLDLPFHRLCCFFSVAESSRLPDVTRPFASQKAPPTSSRDRGPNWWIDQLQALARSQSTQSTRSSGHPTQQLAPDASTNFHSHHHPSTPRNQLHRSNEHHSSSVWEQQTTNISYLSRLGFLLEHKHDNQQFIQHT